MMQLTNLREKWLALKRISFSDTWMGFKKNRDLFIFMVFLLISTTFWFLNALRDTYVASFTFPVRFANIPENEIIEGSESDLIHFKVKGTGFSILRQYANNTFIPPTYDVSKLLRIQTGTDNRAYLISKEQQAHFSSQLFEGVELIEILPDTFFISLQKLETKKVPVRFNGHINLEKQFLIGGPLVFNPDSVLVSGPKNLVDTLSAIPTHNMVYNNVQDTLIDEVILSYPPGIIHSLKSASMIIPVETFSEASVHIPIEFVGLPDSLRGKTFPSEVLMTYRIGLSCFDKVAASDFRAIVDASSAFSSEKPARLKVKIDRSPAGIHSVDYAPIFVEYLIENKR